MLIKLGEPVKLRHELVILWRRLETMTPKRFGSDNLLELQSRAYSLQMGGDALIRDLRNRE
jgi:hypothetical protein